VLDLRVLDLNEIVVNVDKMLRRVLGEDIELKVLLGHKLAKIKADSGQIELALLNLVVNARDAMPNGGKLTVETMNVELDAAYAQEHVGVTPGPHVMLAVSDTGVGMDTATQARIFEPFFTTKELGKGTGLGLSTVFGIINQCSGHIWLYSEPGSGTTFKIYLPRAKGRESMAYSVSPPALDRVGSETILLVEDEDQVRTVAAGILRRAGYNVLETQGAGEALLVCEQHPVKIHLLLTDVVMPKMNGRDLAARIAAMRPETRVVYMSGYTDNAITQHGVLDSDVAFVQKPFTPDSLIRKIRQVLDVG
jgi:two-component system cell cycle sensor histidine kinase/response regulator CckA